MQKKTNGQLTASLICVFATILLLSLVAITDFNDRYTVRSQSLERVALPSFMPDETRSESANPLDRLHAADAASPKQAGYFTRAADNWKNLSPNHFYGVILLAGGILLSAGMFKKD